MDNREKKAITGFRNGFNCAQSVLDSFGDVTGLEKSVAVGVSAGFGGGMGRLQLTCGAVTGAFMVIGRWCSLSAPDNKETKERSYRMIREFSQRFMENHGSLSCRDLLHGTDLNTEAGQAAFRNDKLGEEICEKCILTAVSLTGELIRNTSEFKTFPMLYPDFNDRK